MEGMIFRLASSSKRAATLISRNNNINNANITIRTISSSASKTTSSASLRAGGMGFGNVHQQMIPADDFDTNLFRHVVSPKTVSVIG